MNALISPLSEYTVIEDIKTALSKGRTPIRVTGCIGSEKCNLMAAVTENSSPVRLIIAENDLRAKEIMADFMLYDKNTCFYPAKDILFYSADVRGNTLQCERLNIIKKIIDGESLTVVTGIAAGVDRLPPVERLKNQIIHIDMDSVLEPEILAEKLVSIGYSREGIADMPGQFAVRGGIVDVFPVQDEVPVRIEFWGDAIDSIRSYDAASQRSIANTDSCTIFPAQEITISKEEQENGLKLI